MVEKLPGSGEHRRASRHVTMANHTNPLALLQRLDDLAVHRDAADILDLATGDRLAVGNQRQGFQQRAGVTLRTLFPEPADTWRKALTHPKAVTTGHLFELKGADIAGLVQHLAGLLSLCRRRPFCCPQTSGNADH